MKELSKETIELIKTDGYYYHYADICTMITEYANIRAREAAEKAWDAAVEYENECFCGKCDYCTEVVPNIEDKAIDKDKYLYTHHQLK